MNDTAAPSEISYFRALAFYEAGEISAARALCEQMIAAGKQKIKDKDVSAYYGVGSPCPCPFEYNFDERHIVKGSVLKAFGYLGLGKKAEALEAIKDAEKLDPTNFAAHVFHIFA